MSSIEETPHSVGLAGPWIVSFGRGPDAIVRHRDAEDVQAAIDFAGEQHLELAAERSGHVSAANILGLLQLRRTWDPEEFFRRIHSIHG
jgi:hypothetical protein